MRLSPTDYSLPIGTFRPDRIRAIADRFGVDGEAALSNILYGAKGPASVLGIVLISFKPVHSIANTR
jgi:hypothetical protein